MSKSVSLSRGRDFDIPKLHSKRNNQKYILKSEVDIALLALFYLKIRKPDVSALVTGFDDSNNALIF